MSTPLHQVAIAVITAGCVSFASAAFYAGQQDKQIQSNANDIAEMQPEVAKIAVISNRLDTYEKLVIDGQEKQQEISNQILNEMRGMRKDTSSNSGKIGSIETDIQWIKKSINN
ncbi:TMhelix containing protein [Vibrio phage 1.225.O._10N.261.48.B7]|nr:TMhelix containing protein [Vibrio phage 1.225.O._10N.261.48.B7]